MNEFNANNVGNDLSSERVQRMIERQNIAFLSLWFTDITGLVKSVIVPASRFEQIITEGIVFDGSSIEGFSRVAESDMQLHPDLSTFVVLPWTENDNRTARIICDIRTPDGVPFIGDPRQALKQMLSQADDAGFGYAISTELEFFLFYTDPYGKPVLDAPYDNATYFDIPVEPAQVVQRDMVNALSSMGIDVLSAHSESGHGQHEIDLASADALTAADHVLTARVVLKAVAQRHNLLCSFMPRPLENSPGSGMHLQQRFYSAEGKSLMTAASESHGISSFAENFIAGQLFHARSMAAILAPVVNSYKRLGKSFEAPHYVTWANVSRGALIRVPSGTHDSTGNMHVELRCPDPTANPYLAFAVMLAGGLDGLRQQIPLVEPTDETLLQRDPRQLRQLTVLPYSLEEALDELSQNDVILNALGPYISDRYIDAKRQEIDSYNSAVTSWEIDRYLNRF